MATGKHNKKNRILPVLLLCVLIVAVIIGTVSARYFHEDSDKNILAAKEFYFTSNLLSENGANYVLNSNATEVSFTLENSVDELRFSQDPITYKVYLGESTEPFASGTLANGGTTTATVTLSNLVSGENYVVTAVGEAGYVQTLSATFTVSDNDENIYKHVDTSNSAYVLLTVWTENLSGNVSIEVTCNGLIPDNTDPILQNVYNYNNGYGKMVGYDAIIDSTNFQSTYSSYTYRFFIDSASNITAKNFDVTITKSDNTHIAIAADPK